MLFKQTHLNGIRSGTIKLAFRKWEKASVKSGTLLKTAIGLVEIISIESVKEDTISDSDARNAGFESKQELLQSFRQNDNGFIFKIELRYHSADPRIELREQHLTDEMYFTIKEKLLRLDKFSKQGKWTKKVLLTIMGQPHLHAIGIARLTNFEKEWLKPNIRKLKNLGLTISHEVGYEISPLGKAFIEKLTSEHESES